MRHGVQWGWGIRSTRTTHKCWGQAWHLALSFFPSATWIHTTCSTVCCKSMKGKSMGSMKACVGGCMSECWNCGYVREGSWGWQVGNATKHFPHHQNDMHTSLSAKTPKGTPLISILD